MKNSLMTLIVMVAACSGDDPNVATPDGAPTADARDGAGLDGGADADPLAPDAAPSSPDARPGGNLGPGAQCNLLRDDCVTGYTCRLATVNPTTGACGAVSATPFVEQSACGLSSQCGYDMDCADFCMIWCDPLDPGARCAAGQACDVSAIDPDLGLCHF